MDSFDHYATNDFLKKWDYSGGYFWGNIYISSSYHDIPTRRSGTKYMFTGDQWAEKDIVDTVTGLDIYTFVVGFACHYQTGCPTMDVSLMNYSRSTQIRINVSSDGKVKIYRGGTLLQETPQDYVSPNTWFHIEAKVVLHDTNGSYEVRLNEVNVLSGSGINTLGASGGVAKIRLGGGGYHQGYGAYDDFFLMDGNASDDPANPNNDFIGDCRIDCIYPNAAGTYTQYTPSEGANYENVDDGTVAGGGDIDDNVTYNEATTIDMKETYNMDSTLSIETPIYAITANSCCRKTDAGKRYFKQLTISGATSDLSEEKHLTDNYKVYQKPLDINPNDSEAWEEADINAIESGTQITV